MSRESFYRRYRSQTFPELVGQSHIVQTLGNAIENQRLAHAYIFSGPRGTGKTSTARIFAKALNCKEGMTITPCGDCQNCKGITSGHSVDVLEIDAASNTGVDHMRELNSQVNFMPVECLYKFYIIDEVHMLSTGAFNALLKTLEEPPPNVIFVLATTEPHKIPATIQSRCQHLYFRLLKHHEILGHLQYVCEQEAIQIDDVGLSLIVRNSDGCMRDALSLLDQVYSFKGQSISSEDVRVLLGVTSTDALLGLVTAILKGDESATISQLKGMSDDGGDMSQLCRQLTESFQDLVYAKHQILGELDMEADAKAQYMALAEPLTLPQLMGFLESFAELGMSMRHFPNPGLLLQVKTIFFMQQYLAPVPAVSEPAPRPAVVEAPVKETPVKETIHAQAVGCDPVPTPSKKDSPPPLSQTGTLAEKWPSILAQIQKEKKGLHMILNQSSVLKHDGSRVDIQLSDDYQLPFFLEKLKEDKYKGYLETLLMNALGQETVAIQFQVSDVPLGDNPSGDNTSDKDASDEQVATPVAAEAFPNSASPEALKTLNQIVDVFQGTVIS